MIPVIDISDWFKDHREGKQRIASEWFNAFTTCGFAIIVGHGVPSHSIQSVYELTQQYFQQPIEEKMKNCLHLGYGAGGFTPMGVETVAKTRTYPDGAPLEPEKKDPRVRSDLVESLIFHKTEKDVRPAVPNFLDSVYSYWDHVASLLNTLMEITAVSLRLEKNHFAHSFREPSCVLRFAHYPPQQEKPPEGQLRYGEHTDYTGFTILKTFESAEQTDLQIKIGNEWIGCSNIKDSFIINAGDLIEVWTNGVFKSNPHRVLNPSEKYNTSRYSVVFFTGPNNDTIIECLPTCNPGTPLYPPEIGRAHV